MLGFNPRFWVIRDIIRILDNQNVYISSNELVNLLGDSTLGQVKNV